jgi:hypothetical protein
MSIAVRSYLAGSGATSALLAGALIAFLTVAAFVAFDDLPGGGGDSDADVVRLGSGEQTAAAAASAVGTAPGAVAATPVAPAPGVAGAAAVLAAAPGGPDAPAAVTPPGSPGTPVPPRPLPPQEPGTPGAPVQPNIVNGLLTEVDNTAAGTLGVNPNLGGLTEPVTDRVDDTLRDLTGKDLNDTIRGVVGPPGKLLGGKP